MTSVNWDIRREGRTFEFEEALARDALLPNARIEVIDGKFFHNDEERLAMLATMLENLGIDAAVRLGDPKLWREAVAGKIAPKHAFATDDIPARRLRLH